MTSKLQKARNSATVSKGTGAREYSSHNLKTAAIRATISNTKPTKVSRSTASVDNSRKSK